MTTKQDSLHSADTGRRAAGQPSRVGFIDLGSNSCRLCVVQYDKRGGMNVLTRIKCMVRLGEGAFSSRMLQTAAMDRTLACLHEFAQIGRAYRIEKMLAVGTAALRSAANREAFLRCVKERTGIDIDVVSGMEEARLIRVGLFDALPKSDTSYLFIDIGGGSTELSISDRERIACLESLDIGCVSVSEGLDKGKSGRIAWTSVEAMIGKIREDVASELEPFKTQPFAGAIASSGTALALYRLASLEAQRQNAPLKQTAEGGVLPYKAVQAVAKQLAAMTLEDRKKLPGLSEARAEVIVGGAVVLLAVMRALALDAVTVTESNLQDGQRIDYQTRQYAQSDRSCRETRKRHVKRFARRFFYDKTHGRQIRRLVAMLSDGAVAMGLATEDASLRELLGYAARLQDVGISLSYAAKHRHGAYLVRHSHLPGFTDHEIETLARLVYRHASPSDELPAYLGAQPMSDNEKVAGLCLFFADMLDKTHRSVVESVQWGQDENGLKLVVRTRMAASIEKAGAAKMIKHFKRVLDRALSIEFIDPVV